jgi:hypothetical protein
LDRAFLAAKSPLYRPLHTCVETMGRPFLGLVKKKKVVDLERGPLSLVTTTEELLDRKIADPCLENREYGRRDPSR